MQKIQNQSELATQLSHGQRFSSHWQIAVLQFSWERTSMLVISSSAYQNRSGNLSAKAFHQSKDDHAGLYIPQGR